MQHCIGIESRVHVERRRANAGRCGLAVGRSRDDAKVGAGLRNYWKRCSLMMFEMRRHFFVLGRQCDPGLQAVHECTACASLGWRALGVGDAATGNHPIDVAGANGLARTEVIAMDDFAIEQIGDRRQINMRMRAYVEALANGELHGAHVVEENERADESTERRGQRATNAKTAEVARSALDHEFDAFAVGLVVMQFVFV